MKTLNVCVLGSPDLRLGSEPQITQLSDKAVALIGYLAVSGTAASRSLLAGLLWSDQTEERARGNLRTTLSRVRRAIPNHVDANRTLVWLAGPRWVDVEQIESVNPREVASLHRGRLMQDLHLIGAELFDEWRAAEELQVRARVVGCLMQGAETAMAGSDDARDGARECLTLVRRVTAIDPWNEQAQRLLISALARTKGRISARAEFDRFSSRLRTELDAAPEAETLQLVRTLDRREERVIDLRGDDGDLGPLLPLRAPGYVASEGADCLIGREVHLASMRELLHTDRGKPGTVLIHGQSGSGRTALLSNVACEARSLGALVLSVSCRSEPLHPNEPIMDLHAECRAAAGSTASSTAPTSTSTSDPGSIAEQPVHTIPKTLAGQIRQLSQVSPVLVVVDDLDRASAQAIAIIARLGSLLADSGIGMVAAYRSDAARHRPQFRRTVVQMVQAGASRLPALGPFSRADVATLVAGLSETGDGTAAHRIAELVWRAAAGHPRYSAAWIRHLWGMEARDMSAGQAATADAVARTPPVPDALTDHIWMTVDALGEIAACVARRAALLGESVTLDALINAVDDTPDEALAGVDRLITAGVLCEPDEQDVIRFAQPLVAWALKHDAGWLERRKLTTSPQHGAAHIAPPSQRPESEIYCVTDAV